MNVRQIDRRQIQIVRCIAIIMVIVHHTVNNLPNSIWGVLLIPARSDVTIFFMISGFLFERYFDKYNASKVAFIQQKLRHLMIPYLFWSLLLYTCGWIAHVIIGGKLSAILTDYGFGKLTWMQILCNIVLFENYYIEYLWFIYVLFVFFLVNILICRRPNRLCCAIFIMTFGSVINYYFALPHLVLKFLKHFSDFLIGRIAFAYFSKGQCKQKDKAMLIVLVIAVFAFVVQCIVLEKTGGMTNCLLFDLVQYGMWWSVGVLCYMLAKRIADWKIAEGISRIGDYSYDIYLIHIPYVVPVFARLVYGITNMWGTSLMITVVCGIFIPLGISKYIIRRIPLLRKIALGM